MSDLDSTVRWKGKATAAQRSLRYHKTDPTRIVVLLGLSFERESDIVRIEAFLQR